MTSAPDPQPHAKGDAKGDEKGGDKRTRILAAARAVCARVGFESARMEAIAAEAHVSKGTLYRFFESKEDLLLEGLIDSHLGESYLEEGWGPPAATAPGERLARLLESHVELLVPAGRRMLLNMQVWGLVAGEPRRRERLAAALRERIYPQREAQVAEALAADVAAGRYRDDLDAPGVVAALIALFDGFLYRSTFDPGRADPAGLRRAFGLLLDGIRADGGEARRG